MSAADSLKLTDDVKIDLQVVESIKPSIFDNIWNLFYMERGRPRHKVVKLHGSLKENIEKCRNYCEQTQRTFLRVEPFITDLDADARAFRSEL